MEDDNVEDGCGQWTREDEMVGKMEMRAVAIGVEMVWVPSGR